MNVKDKATAIVNQFWMVIPFHKPLAIKLAVIHVKGIIDELDSISTSHDIDLSNDISYWQQVLTELNQM